MNYGHIYIHTATSATLGSWNLVFKDAKEPPMPGIYLGKQSYKNYTFNVLKQERKKLSFSQRQTFMDHENRD